jgi:hypothetical protein
MNNTINSNNLEDIYLPIIIVFSSIVCLCSIGLCFRLLQYCGQNK